MYLFYMERNGYIPMGSDGMMKVPAAVRSSKALRELAAGWRANRSGRVYAMASWTQAMSELSPCAFEEYIARNGRVVVG